MRPRRPNLVTFDATSRRAPKRRNPLSLQSPISFLILAAFSLKISAERNKVEIVWDLIEN
jgi:hypothetical protein